MENGGGGGGGGGEIKNNNQWDIHNFPGTLHWLKCCLEQDAD